MEWRFVGVRRQGSRVEIVTVDLHGPAGLRVIGPGVCLLLVGTGLRLHQTPASMREALNRMDEVAREGRLAGGLVAVQAHLNHGSP